MSDAKEQLLRGKGFGFFGAITASLSHEINNVFATINELSGLLDDFISAADQGTPLNMEKVKRITQRIAVQVGRGQGYVKQLNTYAHTVDDKNVTTVLNDTVNDITAICRRFGVLRRVEINTSFPETSPRIEDSAFELQHIVYRCIDIVLDASKQGDVLEIGVEPEGEGACLVFVNKATAESVPDLESKLEFLNVLVAEIRGTVESVIKTGEPVRLAISLPRAQKT